MLSVWHMGRGRFEVGLIWHCASALGFVVPCLGNAETAGEMCSPRSGTRRRWKDGGMEGSAEGSKC